MKPSNLRSWLAFACCLCASITTSFGQALPLRYQLLNYWNFETNYNDNADWQFGSASTFADTGTPGVGTSHQTSALLGGPTNYVHCNNASQPSYITVPASTDIYLAGKSLSVSVWIRITNFTKSWECVFSTGDAESNYRLQRAGTANWLEFVGGNSGTYKEVAGGASYPVNDGKWHHIVCINDAVNGNEQFWQDGVRIGYQPVTGVLVNNTTTARLLIGENPGATGRQWGGDIADMAMWTRVLSATEITNIYRMGTNGVQLSTLLAAPDLDSDGDGIPDWWCQRYFGHPNGQADDLTRAGDDWDGDGLTNLQEYTNHNGQLSSNPKLYDTDGDGATDGQEFAAGTNPNVADTDGDGLWDGDEINSYHTSPLLTDTDGDGMNDNQEVFYQYDPLVPNTGFDFGLQGYWPMDTGFDSPAPYGWATYGTGGVVLTNAGKFGNAASFQGSSYLEVWGYAPTWDFQPVYGGGQNWSVSMWFTLDISFSKGWQCLIAKGDAGNTWRIARAGDNPYLNINVGNNIGGDIPLAQPTASPTTWHQIVLVARINDHCEFWYDGVKAFTCAGPALGSVDTRLWIGNNPGNTPGPGMDRQWQGKIDDVAIWTRALSPTAIVQMWNGGAGRSVGDLIAHPVFQFTDTLYNPVTGSVTLTWSSLVNQTYALLYSTNVFNITNVVNASINSQGASTTYGPFAKPVPNAQRLFFRVKQN
jgi:Concanavalin A-like lectin/glucanases superfamily/Bacterial TSP3 repeat